MSRVVIALFALLSCVSCVSCVGNATTSDSAQKGSSATQTKAIAADMVEVLYMHGKQRCATCIAIGTEAEAFVKGLGNEKVVMRDIDFSTPEGEKIADKYEISSSSIIIVRGDKVDNLTAVGFRYARNNPEQFRKDLDESIQKMLN